MFILRWPWSSPHLYWWYVICMYVCSIEELLCNIICSYLSLPWSKSQPQHLQEGMASASQHTCDLRCSTAGGQERFKEENPLSEMLVDGCPTWSKVFGFHDVPVEFGFLFPFLNSCLAFISSGQAGYTANYQVCWVPGVPTAWWAEKWPLDDQRPCWSLHSFKHFQKYKRFSHSMHFF